jgi:hypothetical protein
MTTFVFDERLETLRDALRQAAVHSPSSRTRWAAEACLEQPDPVKMVRLTQSLSCAYAPRLRALVSDYWTGDRAC